MRKAMITMLGLMMVMGGVAGPPQSEAADACSLNGTYNLSGLGEAAGFLGVLGDLVFTPNGPCTSGTVGGSVTIARQNEAATTAPLSGTYAVTTDGVVTVTVPGVIQLTGLGSLMGGNIFNAVHFVVTFDPPQPQALSATATRNPPTGLSTVLDRSPSTSSVSNTTTATSVYAFTVPANTLLGGKLLRGRLLYLYTNNTGSPKNLAISLLFGGSLINGIVIPNLSTGGALGELEFVLGDTVGSTFQVGGFRGLHADPTAGSILLATVGLANKNPATPQPISIFVSHSAASPNLTFSKLSFVLELL